MEGTLCARPLAQLQVIAATPANKQSPQRFPKALGQLNSLTRSSVPQEEAHGRDLLNQAHGGNVDTNLPAL